MIFAAEKVDIRQIFLVEARDAELEGSSCRSKEGCPQEVAQKAGIVQVSEVVGFVEVEHSGLTEKADMLFFVAAAIVVMMVVPMKNREQKSWQKYRQKYSCQDFSSYFDSICCHFEEQI
ncbi:MAG: hypothetical protein K5984_05000 [Bacteroidales bacterium]|nr:hypothetical protein [Bacteroidales bacterium]